MALDDLQAMLAQPGNAYRTKVRISACGIALTQRNLLFAIIIGAIAIGCFWITPWLGAPLLAIALLYAIWVKALQLEIEGRRYRIRNGLWPLVRTHVGPFSDFTHVEVRAAKHGGVSSGRGNVVAIQYDLSLNGEDATGHTLYFPVWEGGTREQTLAMAHEFAHLLGCEVRETEFGKT